MGDQGPCGPCSEIHVDIRSAEEKSKVDGKELVNKDHPQVVELWNLVFMQYNRKADGSLEDLPAKHIDTGMGFERLCMVLQGVTSNYDTDVFTPIIREIETISNTDYGKDGKVDIATRVIADHVRAVAFSIADGQMIREIVDQLGVRWLTALNAEVARGVNDTSSKKCQPNAIDDHSRSKILCI